VGYIPGAAGATNLLPPQPGRGAALLAAAHSSIVLNGDALVSAAAGGRTESSDVPLGMLGRPIHSCRVSCVSCVRLCVCTS
jgi:hypothetical protein